MTIFPTADDATLLRVYSGFCAVREMDLPKDVLVRLLSSIGDHNPDHWSVVGIAPSALQHFASLGFKKPAPGSFKINRSHLVDRFKWMGEWLDMPEPLNFEDWLQFYSENDCTVLRLASRNVSGCDEDYIPIDPALGLFKKAGFSFSFSQKREGSFLRGLHEIVRKQASTDDDGAD